MRIGVRDDADVGQVRRQVGAMAANAGFDRVSRDELAVVATELATNLVRHGTVAGTISAVPIAPSIEGGGVGKARAAT